MVKTPGKKTFVFITHDAEKFGDTPVFKNEIVEEIYMSHQQAAKLTRAMHEIFKYLTTGYPKTKES